MKVLRKALAVVVAAAGFVQRAVLAFLTTFIVGALLLSALGYADGRARAGGGGVAALIGQAITAASITLTGGQICFNAACTAKCQFTGGNLTCNGMTIIQGDSGQLIESLGTGAAGAYYASAGAYRSDLTTAPQFICGGASSCGFQGVTGQTTQVDCGGGTCTAQLGVTNATTTTVGRSGQTTNLNGNVAVGSNFTSNLSTSSASGNQFACSGAATCNLQGASAQTTSVDCGGGTCVAQLGVTNATTTTVGRSGQTMNVNGNVAIGGGSTLTKYITGTVAVTGGSVTAGACVNQGAAITETGAAAGDACYIGLPVTPGNGLTYGCFTSSNACQIYACNASAGALTSVTQTERCTVIH